MEEWKKQCVHPLIPEKKQNWFMSTLLKNFILSQNYFQHFRPKLLQFEEAVNSWKDGLLMESVRQPCLRALSSSGSAFSAVNHDLAVRTFCSLLRKCLLNTLEIHICCLTPVLVSSASHVNLVSSGIIKSLFMFEDF